MTHLIVTLALFLDAVSGAAHPAITPAAQLVNRQGVGIEVLWTFDGTSYWTFGFSGGMTVTSTGSNWAWCDYGQTECYIATACALGTLYYYAGRSITSMACEASESCATDYLSSSVGARSRLAHPMCRDRTYSTRNYFVESSTAVSATTTSAPEPGFATSIPTSSSLPSSYTPIGIGASTPVGAIVGGVVGGLAALALAVIAVLFLLRHRRQRAIHNNKHTSVMSQDCPIPGSRPPMHQGHAGQNSNAYPTHGSVQGEAMPANIAAGPRPGDAEWTGNLSQIPESPPPVYQNQAGQNLNAYPTHRSVQGSEMSANGAAGVHPGDEELMGSSHQPQAQDQIPNSSNFEVASERSFRSSSRTRRVDGGTHQPQTQYRDADRVTHEV